MAAYTYESARLRLGANRMRQLAARAAVSALALSGLTACKDPAVPFLDAPTSIPQNQLGVQNAITGVLATSRGDIFNYVTWMNGFARDATQFQGTESRFVTELLGKATIHNDDFIGSTIWDNSFRNAKTMNAVLAVLPKVSTFSAADTLTVAGIAQTLKAFQFMMVAETHDTAGVPLYGIDQAVDAAPAAILCNKDVWAYIVALLDSGNAELTLAGSNPLPIALTTGFSSVNGSAAAFAAFNRALAGKAGLEFAYATGRPTDTLSIGSPNAGALTRADSAIGASALFNPAALVHPVPNAPVSVWDPLGVFLTFSGNAGDLPNPVTLLNTTLYYLNDFIPDLDTADFRVKAKLIPNPQLNAQATYAALAMPCDSTTLGNAVCSGAVGVTYGEYPSVSASIPIIRNEGLTLVRAQVQIGLGNFATALGFINSVRTNAGGRPPYPASVAATYPSIRNALLHEQRLSTTYEASGDRDIALRIYNLATTRDQTFAPADLHTTLIPISKSESDARSGSLSTSCP